MCVLRRSAQIETARSDGLRGKLLGRLARMRPNIPLLVSLFLGETVPFEGFLELRGKRMVNVTSIPDGGRPDSKIK